MEHRTNNRPKIAALVCTWCSYAGADAAGTSRLQYDDSVRILRFPCTGRIDPTFIVKAFEQGVDGVLVSGCHPGDCHYATGNLYARRRFNVFRKFMEFLGLDRRRLQFSWVSAAEGMKWAEVVNAVSKDVKELCGENFRWAREIPNGQDKIKIRENIEKIDKKYTHSTEKLTPANEQELTEQVRKTARELLEQKRVDVVLGYAAGTIPGTTTPFFASTSELSNRFVWSRFCVNNLAVYLTKPLVRKLGKVAIIAKPCDTKAIVGLIQENQLKRENIFIIGLTCDGVMEGENTALKCFACVEKVPTFCDELIGKLQGKTQPLGNPLHEAVELLEKVDAKERWNFWQSEFERCIRCYACRTVCPFCYCETCISDKHRPQWISVSPRPEGNTAWNIIRAVHLAGRCIECNECARVCPVGIRLDLLNSKIAMEIKREFNYTAGIAVDATPPLATYKPNDSQEFIR